MPETKLEFVMNFIEKTTKNVISEKQFPTKTVPSGPELVTMDPSHCPLLLSYACPVGAMVDPG